MGVETLKSSPTSCDTDISYKQKILLLKAEEYMHDWADWRDKVFLSPAKFCPRGSFCTRSKVNIYKKNSVYNESDPS